MEPRGLKMARMSINQATITVDSMETGVPDEQSVLGEISTNREIDSQMSPRTPLRKVRLKRSGEKQYAIENSESDGDFVGSDSDEFKPPSGDFSDTSSSSPSDNENDLVTIPNPTESNENTSPTDKKVKKRIRKPEKWIKNKRKCLKDSGKEYISSRGKLVKEREMGPICKCRLKCPTKFGNGETRKKIFDEYWALGSLQRQRDYLCSCLDVLPMKYRRAGINVKQPRKPNMTFSFLQNAKKTKVCKTFLINTLDITERTLRTVITAKCTGIGYTGNDNRGKHKNHSKMGKEVEESVRAHINSVPRIESHYLRAQTTREFIGGGLTVAEMHRNYKSLRELANKPAANYDAYSRIFNTQFNIGFNVPKKDQCDLCVSYNNLAGEEKLAQQEGYEKHLQEKELRREVKAKDIENCKTEKSQIVAIYDLQAVMPVPMGESSAFFYHSKLNCYNFTITDMNDKSTKCFFWHEGLAQRGATEIGSCVFRYLEMVESQNPNCDIIFYSDNCCGQQKNRFVLSMYHHAVTTLNINSITHKFLVKGHTQNEGDTVHSLIQKNIKRAKKSGPIYVPDQYVSLIRTAKKTGEPFEVHELDFSSFYDLKALSENKSLNFIKNENGDQIKTSQISMVEFKKGAEKYRYKTSYSGEWMSAHVHTGRSLNKKRKLK